MIKIKISQRTNETCLKALKAALELYSGNARPLIEILKNGFTQPADFNDEAVEEFNSYLKTKELADGSNLKKVLEKIVDNLGGKKDLTFDDLTLICNNLELIERLWIGQWNHLFYVVQNAYFVSDKELSVIIPLRDKITNAYSRKGFNAYSSYGIYSPELKDEIRLLYAFQKVYRYEKNARGTDSSASFRNIVGKDIPEIFLPYQESITFKSMEEIKKYADDWMQKQKELYQFELDRRKIYFDNGIYYFPTETSTSYAVEPGDTVHLKQNDYFLVEKTKENLEKWNY